MGTFGHIQLRAGPAGSPGITLGEARSPQRMGRALGCRALGSLRRANQP